MSSSIDFDWTPRKRLKPSEGAVQKEQEAPFAFVKKPRRCTLPCCTALATSVTDGAELLKLEKAPAVFLLPPPCEVSWFSGLSMKNQIGLESLVGESDEDPFMDKEKVKSQPPSGRLDPEEAPSACLGILGHELEIDDCLRCAEGGYQHFRSPHKLVFIIFF